MLSGNSLNLALVLPLVGVLFLSGCVGQGSGIIGDGVQIDEFSSDFTSVDSGEKVTLYLKTSNTGATEAKNVKVEIAGIDVREWRGTTTQNIGNLLPVDPQTNTAGGTSVKTFGLQAPTLARGLQFTYRPIAYVSYDYESTSVKSISLVDIDELRTLQQQGETLSVGAVSDTGGPLSVDIQTGEIVKTGSGSEAYNRFPLNIVITNSKWGSGGTVIPKSGAGNDQYPVQVNIDLPSQLSASDCKLRDTVDLLKGQSAWITCDMRVTRPPEKREDVLITVEMNYRYQIKAETSITVTGTK